jgi:hypothetical protein
MVRRVYGQWSMFHGRLDQCAREGDDGMEYRRWRDELNPRRRQVILE